MDSSESKSDLNPDSELVTSSSSTEELESNGSPMNPIAGPSHSKESRKCFLIPYETPDTDSNDESELQRERKSNQKVQNAMVKELLKDPGYQEAIAALAALREPPCEPSTDDDSEESLHKAKRRRLNSEATGSRVNSSYSRIDRVIIPVEEITHAHIVNVAQTVAHKTHSTKSGTSCHQCRQKTLDQKTCCRNPDCEGVRGQFCGVCLRDRYDEDAVAALQNPNWHCPVCRGICSCSFCRIREESAPTGLLEEFQDPDQDPENHRVENDNETDDSDSELELKVSKETSSESNTKNSDISNKVEADECSTDESDLSFELNIVKDKIMSTDSSDEVIDTESSSESSSDTSSIRDLSMELDIFYRSMLEDLDTTDDEDDGRRLVGFWNGFAVYRYPGDNGFF